MKKIVGNGLLSFVVWLLLFNHVEAQHQSLRITVPSDSQARIAPLRDFYVLGNIEGEVASTDILEVSLYEDGSMLPIRKVEVKKGSNVENIDYPLLSYYGKNKTELLQAMMPDIAMPKGEMSLFTQPFVKGMLSDHSFTAVIHGGSYQKDIAIDSLSPLKKGAYQLNVLLKGDDGTIKASTFKTITVDHAKKRVLSRFSPSDHFSSVKEFATAEQSDLFLDPFPGYWNPSNVLEEFENRSIFAEILPKWRLADSLEYQAGLAQFLIYNVSETSATYSVEIGTLEEQGVVENRERLQSYYYQYGEPFVKGIKSQWIPFSPNDKLQITRADKFVGVSKDLEQAQVDLDLADGVEAMANETLVINGVVTPLQNKQEDIIKQEDNTFTINNRISYLAYTIVDQTGEELLTREENVGVNRMIEGKNRASILEFKHEFVIPKDWQGKALQVFVKGYDKYHAFVEGTEESFKLLIRQSLADTLQSDHKNTEMKETANSIEPKKPTDFELPNTGNAQTAILEKIGVVVALGGLIGYVFPIGRKSDR